MILAVFRRALATNLENCGNRKIGRNIGCFALPGRGSVLYYRKRIYVSSPARITLTRIADFLYFETLIWFGPF